MGVDMKRILLSGLGLFFAAAAHAASVPLVHGPTEPPTLLGPLNALVNSINTIISPLTGPDTGVYKPFPPTIGATGNAIGFVEGQVGSPAIIRLQDGGDPNGAIQILPNGSGNIVLFSGYSDLGSTGYLQFANAAQFVKAAAAGVERCPGGLIRKRTGTEVHGTIRGYILVKDWLGDTHGLVAC